MIRTLIPHPFLSLTLVLVWFALVNTFTLGNLILGSFLCLVIPLITAFVGDERVAQTLEGILLPDQVPEGYIAHFGPDLTLRRSSMRANALQRRNLLAEIEDLSLRYPVNDMLVEILHGDQDFAVGYNIHSTRLKNAIDGADLRPLEGHGHMIQHAAPEAVIDAIDRAATRSEERRVGKECRSRWSPNH